MEHQYKKRALLIAILTILLGSSSNTSAFPLNLVSSTAIMSTRSNTVVYSASNKIAIIGGTGRLGREAVYQLSAMGIPSRCLIRTELPPEFLATVPHVEFIQGDVTKTESLSELLEGCSACLALHGATRRTKILDILPWVNPERDPAHPKNVNYVGIQNIIEAARASKTCKRIVRITGKGENPWSLFSILINMLGSFAKAWNYEGEQLLRNCEDVDYTIIRPGVMKQEQPDNARLKNLALVDNGGDLKVSSVAYTNIATLCIQVLDYPNAARATLCAMNVNNGQGEETYVPLLLQVKPDRRTFPANMMMRHIQAVYFGGFSLLVVLTSMVFTVSNLVLRLLSKIVQI